MNVDKIDYNSFGYSTQLSRLYKKGKLPTVKVGLYGIPLTKKNCSNEHIIPHSLGGKTNPTNIALADRDINSRRGNNDIHNFLTLDLIKQYLIQFINVTVDGFNGNKYIHGLIKTFQSMGFDINKNILQ